MTRNYRNLKFHASNRPRKRPLGFTLVEVLVVIAIIGILVGLLVPAVMNAQIAARRMAVKTDMENIGIALENFRTSLGGGQYPPDGTNPADLQQFCKGAWPRVSWVTANPNYNASPPQVMFPNITPDTALCFWLGGAQDGVPAANSPPNFIGFSANPQNPFDGSQSRTPPTFDFPRDTSPLRVVKTTLAASNLQNITNTTPPVYWNLYQCYPPNRKDPVGGNCAPYVYFKAVAGQYAVSGSQPVVAAVPNCQPYLDSNSTTTPQAFVNPQKYQLLCPGLDGIYGKTADGKPPQYPSGKNYDPNNGLDDMTNFTSNPTVGNDTK